MSSILADVRDAHDEFLKRYMESERRALDLADRLAGRDPEQAAMVDEIRVLVVEEDGAVCRALTECKPKGFTFEHAMSGGEALDRCSTSRFHITMVSNHLSDLPGSMVVSSLKTQNPEVIAISFTPPPGGKVEIVETSRRIPVVADFNRPEQILERLDELALDFRAKARERR